MSILKRIIVPEMERLVPEAKYADTDWRSWYFNGKLYEDMFRDPIFLALYRDMKKLEIATLALKRMTANEEHWELAGDAMKDMEDVE